MPRLNPQTTREGKLLNLTDARVAVEWLNAAKDANATGYERIVSIRCQLEELRSLCVRLTEYGTDSPAFQQARGQLEAEKRKLPKQRAMVTFGKENKLDVSAIRALVESHDALARPVNFPAIDTNCAAYKKLYRQTERLHSAVNEALSKYAFRPRVTYFVAGGVWRGGMVPDDNSRWFAIKVNHQTTISEADAAMSLIRLDLLGEIGKVRLCEMCQARWRVVAKSNYRFCSPKCRERFYAKHSDYHDRKAANQRAYRQRMKEEYARAKVTAVARHV